MFKSWNNGVHCADYMSPRLVVPFKNNEPAVNNEQLGK